MYQFVENFLSKSNGENQACTILILNYNFLLEFSNYKLKTKKNLNSIFNSEF